MEKSSKYLWVSALFFLIFSLTSGIGLCYWQMQKSLDNDIHFRLQQAISSLDVTFSHADLAAQQVRPLLGGECNEKTLTGIRTIVATIPDVRTVNLIKDNEIYCTSIFGGKKFKIDEAEYPNNSLKLLSGSGITPKKSLVVYSIQNTQGDTALISIDGYYLYNILNVLDGNVHLYLKVGDHVMTRAGLVTTKPGIKIPVTLRSDKYNYTVMTDRSDVAGIGMFFHYEQNLIIAIVLASLLLTFLFRNYIQYRNTIEFMLIRGIKHRQLKPYIQPIVDGKTGRVLGGEVLIRFEHPKHGFISPEKFIPVAEQSGLIKQITAICFRDVIEQFQQRKGSTEKGLFICFNTSSVNFQDDDIVALCTQFIEKTKDYQVHLILEITERSSVENTMQTTAVTNKLRDKGVIFSLDDFGTGYANYNYLQQFTPDFIKIDKVFTFNIVTNPASALVVKNMVNLARKFNCKIIAEGVENVAQINVLREMGVSIFQGYYFSKPVAARAYFNLIGSKLPKA